MSELTLAELLRCAADVCIASGGNEDQWRGALGVAFGHDDDSEPGFTQAYDAEMGVVSDPYRHNSNAESRAFALLEAAQRVEERSWP
jgi:hypothetical protein